MNTVDLGEKLKTKLIAWKAKMDDLIQKIAVRGSKENEKVLRKNQDLKMPNSEMSSYIERFIQWRAPHGVGFPDEKYRLWPGRYT